MATASPGFGRESLIPNPDRTSLWSKAFDEPTRRTQLHDDAVAWRTVTGILICIVTIGMLIAFATVAAIAW